MQMSATMRSFCFSHPGAFVIPAEALCENGVEPVWAEGVVEEGRMTPAQRACLDAGFSLYWQRTTALFAAAPGSWFPPRRTNLVVVSDATSVAPYFDPFGGTSSLLYLTDLDTNPEYVAFLLVHNERVSMLRSLRAALICNLSYWLVRDEASQIAFSQAARAAQRPDARVFVRLAEAFGWFGSLGHQPLCPLPQDTTEPCFHVEAAGLFVPKRLQACLTQLCDAADAALRAAMHSAAPRRGTRTRAPLKALCDWMQHARAHLIVKSANGQTVWAPGSSDPGRLHRTLREAGDDAVASLHADFRVVHERSRAFLDALREPHNLPRHSSVLVDGDGVYLSAAEQAVVYELQQPGFNPLAAPAPPFHRLLLGARVMHEWGHLAHAGKLLQVPAARKTEYAQARSELGATFMQVLARVPQRLRAEVADELTALAPLLQDQPAALARKTLARVGDYLANLLCSRLLPAPEMQVYVRNNVRNHLAENLGLVSELARYAYEIHYLALAGMPRTYFFSTSRFTDYFIRPGIVSEDDAHRLFDTAGRVLACYELDESRLAIPEPAGLEDVQNRVAQPSKRWLPQWASTRAP